MYIFEPISTATAFVSFFGLLSLFACRSQSIDRKLWFKFVLFYSIIFISSIGYFAYGKYYVKDETIYKYNQEIMYVNTGEFTIKKVYKCVQSEFKYKRDFVLLSAFEGKLNPLNKETVNTKFCTNTN